MNTKLHAICDSQGRPLNLFVGPTPGLPQSSIADELLRSAGRPELAGECHFNLAVAFHGLPEESQCGLAITWIGHIAFQHFPFVIHSQPQVVRLAADLYEHLQAELF